MVGGVDQLRAALLIAVLVTEQHWERTFTDFMSHLPEMFA